MILTSALVVINTGERQVTAPAPAPTSTTPDDRSQRAAGAELTNARRTATRRDTLARQRRERSQLLDAVRFRHETPPSRRSRSARRGRVDVGVGVVHALRA